MAFLLTVPRQASLMKRYSDGNAAEAFCVSRLEAPGSGRSFGTLAGNTDAAAIVARAALAS